MKTLGLILGTIVLFLGTADADTTFTIGAGTGPECDMTYINAGATSTNYGTATSAWFYDSTSGGSNNNLLFRWDALGDSLNHGGANLYVKACTLLVKSYLASADRATTGQFRCARVRRGVTSPTKWTETGASWENYKALTTWNTSGGRNVSNDIDTTVSITYNWATFSWGTDSVGKFDLTAVAQTMDAGDTAKTHGGFIFYFPWYGSYTTWDQLCQIHTDDGPTTANRPQLKVVYTKAVQPPATSTPPRRRRELSCLDKIRIYSFTDKGALQCADQ